MIWRACFQQAVVINQETEVRACQEAKLSMVHQAGALVWA